LIHSPVAAEIQLLAHRKFGQAWKETPKRGPEHSKGGGSKGSKREPLLNEPPTLAELGIDKKHPCL
jgi:hypothetical protein